MRPTRANHIQQLSALTATIVSSDVTFNLPNSTPGNHVTFDSPTATTLRLTDTDATPTFEQTTFNIPTGSLTINEGTGDDAMTVASNVITNLTAAGSGFTGALSLNGQAGNDSFTVNTPAAGTNGLNLSIDGGTSTNAALQTLTSNNGGGTGNTLIVSDPSATSHAVHISNVSMTASPATAQLITVGGSSLTLFMSGDTLIGSGADLIHVNSPEPIVNLSSNNAFVLGQSNTANVFFVGTSVSPPLTTINVEASGNTYSVTTNENQQRVFGLVLDNRSITNVTKTNPSSSVIFNSGTGRITYTPAPNASGNSIDTLTVTLAGGAQVNINVNVVAVNQAPVVSIASPYTTNEDTAVTLTGETFPGSGIQKIGVADADDAGQTYTLVVTVTKGTVTADNNASPSVIITNNNSASVTLTGTLTAITTMLKDAGPQGATGAPGLLYTPAANANNNTSPAGPATILVTLNDGSLTGSDNSTITINPVNDAPTITVPPTVNLTESGNPQNVTLGSTVFADDASETPGTT